MDDGARARHGVLSAGAALLAIGCTGAPRAPSRAPAPAVATRPARPAPEKIDDTRVVLAPSQPSRGHAPGRYTVVISGNAAAADAWRAFGADYAEGARLVAVHTERDGTPGPVLIMEKRARDFFPAGGDWRYTFADARERPLRAGRLDDCASCHALAPHAGVFR